MRLLVIFLSLYIALPASVYAAGAVSDKTQWLKQSIASLEKTSATYKVPEANSQLSDVHLQRFVANRYLPTKRELEIRLLAQQAHFDIGAHMVSSDKSLESSCLAAPPQQWTHPQNILDNSDCIDTAAVGDAPNSNNTGDSTLKGMVSTCAMQNVTSSAASGKYYKPLSLNYTSQISSQIRTTLKKALQNRNALSDTSVHNNQSSTSSTLYSSPCKITGTGLQIGSLISQTPMVTRDEKSLLSHLMNLNSSGNTISKDKTPPPFPLNLFPEDALRQLISNSAQKVTAPRAYFGSWHNAQASLPSGSFCSHMTRRPFNVSYRHYIVPQHLTMDGRVPARTYVYHPTEILVYPSYCRI